MPASDKPIVLVCDDEPDLRELFRQEVEGMGIKTLEASNGLEALQILEKASPKNPIDAVLTDINMPKLNGLELLAKTRHLGNLVPFVFITGYGDHEKTVTALRLGAFDFLDKPCASDKLRGVIKEAAEMGFKMRKLDEQLDEMCRQSGLQGAELESFRKSQRAIQLLQFQRKAA